MKRCGHGASLPNDDRVGVFGSEDIDAVADVDDLGSANEDHFKRRLAQGGVLGIAGVGGSDELAFADGAVDLASVGVAADADVEHAEPALGRVLDFGGKQNGSGAGAEGGTGEGEVLELVEAGIAEEFEERAGFASGDDEAVDLVKLFGLADEQDLAAEFFETAAVGIEISLKREDTDSHFAFLAPFTTGDTRKHGAAHSLLDSLPLFHSSGCLLSPLSGQKRYAGRY